MYLLSDNIDLHKTKNAYRGHNNVTVNIDKARRVSNTMKQVCSVNELHKSSYE